MSKYYNPQKTRNLFNPDSEEPFVVSRSGIDLFVQCPRCFYLDKRLGVGRPPGFPFSLNSAVDTLLKREFDIHRTNKTAHPLMKEYGIDAIPYSDEKLDDWRDSLRKGIKHHHGNTNLIIRGGIDDVWINPKGELHIVDYKATSKSTEVTLDAQWQDGYKRQMEIYQWLFRHNDFKVSPIGYFVYCNGNADKEAFDAKLEFDIKIIPYEGDDSWVEAIIIKLQKCLASEKIPAVGPECDYCAYTGARNSKEK